MAASREGFRAELVEHGPRLEAVRRRVGTAGVLDIALDHAGVHRHRIPAGTTTIRLLSPPGQVPGDPRSLGAAIRHVALDGAPVALSDARLQGGFHAMEEGWRWIDGTAFVAHERLAYAAELTVEVVALVPVAACPPMRAAA